MRLYIKKNLLLTIFFLLVIGCASSRSIPGEIKNNIGMLQYTTRGEEGVTWLIVCGRHELENYEWRKYLDTAIDVTKSINNFIDNQTSIPTDAINDKLYRDGFLSVMKYNPKTREYYLDGNKLHTSRNRMIVSVDVHLENESSPKVSRIIPRFAIECSSGNVYYNEDYKDYLNYVYNPRKCGVDLTYSGSNIREFIKKNPKNKYK